MFMATSPWRIEGKVPLKNSFYSGTSTFRRGSLASDKEASCSRFPLAGVLWVLGVLHRRSLDFQDALGLDMRSVTNMLMELKRAGRIVSVGQSTKNGRWLIK